ncbi:hypothetical protein A6E13_15745 [Aliivibrio fischeri]|uniref:PDDEXK-like family protein n=1 Tax=Aliivibrio fischeri TaxID=668 RepID=UPI00080DC16E|nr:PD-(D/E)XK nuclease family protein [Aliivibrio fischeri]OCH32025.1 hypothetical protein A6E13_15745 [Aliivibrio fischeri]
MLEKIEKLLHIPKILNEQFQPQKAFNLFKVLRGSRDEVRLHSRFVAELLNPKGCHEQGNIFLAYFVKNILKDTGFDIEFATIEKEWNDIDILIRNRNGQAIIIENKVDAIDQDNQLYRYFELINDRNFKSCDIKIVYLTLDGKKPSDQSIGGLSKSILKNNMQLLSYKIDMINWLKLCKKEAVDHPELRESITQYLSLLSELTHTNQNKILMKKLESWFEDELFKGQPVELLNTLAIVKNNFHARQLEFLREKIEESIDHDVSINRDSSTLSLSDCEKYIAKNRRFEIWVHPFSGENLLQVGFVANHTSATFDIWCPQKEAGHVYDAARKTISEKYSSCNRINQYSVGWKYFSDPIILSESTDSNLRKLSEHHYLESLAEKIAHELNAIVAILRNDRELCSLL